MVSWKMLTFAGKNQTIKTKMNRDNAIFELIEKEHQRQLKGIELIASENFVPAERHRADCQ